MGKKEKINFENFKRFIIKDENEQLVLKMDKKICILRNKHLNTMQNGKT